jgi:hypothetical protein
VPRRPLTSFSPSQRNALVWTAIAYLLALAILLLASRGLLALSLTVFAASTLAAFGYLCVYAFRVAERAKPRKARRGKCPICGYDVRATPQQCPECGTRLTATAREK